MGDNLQHDNLLVFSKCLARIRDRIYSTGLQDRLSHDEDANKLQWNAYLIISDHQEAHSLLRNVCDLLCAIKHDGGKESILAFQDLPFYKDIRSTILGLFERRRSAIAIAQYETMMNLKDLEYVSEVFGEES